MVYYIRLIVFYTKLTNLAQKFKILDKMGHVA